MQMNVVAVGTRMPAWADTAVEAYCRRVAARWSLRVVGVRAPTRANTGDAERCRRIEAERIRAAIGPGSAVVALDERGQPWSTQELADQLERLREQHRSAAFVIGGADGLDPDWLAAQPQRWSLSRLTLPHALARVVVAEQLYRAWSICTNHPYHRE
ncbi:MAG: 23S rRNA (pseudouridine(1915)-N(3))-methyltransferase RlmH [Chromatiales bacterium]|nr:23S rRNA (pseudouridine(1915)-N(3))-methyltransferase RlmH [Chromatiales bacterium]